MKRLLLSLAVPAFLAGCSNDPGSNKSAPNGQNPNQVITAMQEVLIITVQNHEQQPLTNAQVLIGDALNAPFEGNFFSTDAAGQAAVPVELWTTTAAVTVNAPGYVRTTYMAQEPGALTFTMRPSSKKTHHEVRGNTPGLPIQDKDGFVDFGMVMQAFTRLDLLSFDIKTIISPHNDKITALGQDLEIPANISLPKQSERYALFTVTLDKPLYRIYLGKPGINRIFAARGRFPFKSTADQLRKGAEFIDLINEFSITGGAIRDINIKADQTNLDMPTNELKFTETKQLTAPQYRADETYIAAGIAHQSGFMIPTDFKRMTSGEKRAINTLPGSKQLVLGILKKTEDFKNDVDRMSVTLQGFATGATQRMLPIIPNPTLSRDEVLMPKFNTISGVAPIATYSILSKEEEVQQGTAKMKVLNPHWEVYSNVWLERMKLPKWPNDAGLSGKKRWDVNFVGSQTASQAPVGPAMIESATHVTHSSVSF